jgi:hypothetical protein
MDLSTSRANHGANLRASGTTNLAHAGRGAAPLERAPSTRARPAMSGGDPDGDEWAPGNINPLHRAVWQEEDGSRAAAVKAVLDAHTVVDLDRLNLRMPFE